MSAAVAWGVLVLFGALLCLLLPFAAHRSWLLLLSCRSRAERRDPLPEAELPLVTVQLPLYNERHVAGRLVDAACRLDYPRDRLEVQVLDDSTDDTSARVARRVAAWRARGVDIRHLRRSERTGFKAGALGAGLARARGDFLVVLDADFVPPPDLVRHLLPPFRDPRVGMVQCRWDHLNEHESGFTRAQSFLLDGHFLVEQAGRYAGRRFFNFNGTAGMWRRPALEDAGGWEADTLTEDLDVSYRAQMAGWRFVFLGDVGVPAELPSEVGALEIQQGRWAQGGIQTARKILPRLLRGPWPPRVKVEAVFHLLGHLAHPLTLGLAFLLFPAAVARRRLGLDALLGLDLVLFGAATIPFIAFYATAGRRGGRAWWEVGSGVVRTLALGIGLTAPVTRAVLRGLAGGARDPFRRTPKRGVAARSSYGGGSRSGDSLLKLGAGATMLVYIAGALAGGYWQQLPFLALFASGYLMLGIPGLATRAALAAPHESPTRPPEEKEEEREPDEGPGPERLRPDPGLLVGA